jgi:hypothetical protein
LNADARNVKIYRYITRGSSYDIDYEKYKVSFIKDKIHRKVYRVLKEISVDCVINKNNYNEYIGNFTDGSRECDYQSCAYECALAKKNLGKSELKSYRINIDFFDKFQLDAMRLKILNLFKIYFIWDLEYILAIIGAEYGSISKDAVYTTLDKIVADKVTAVDIYNRKGIIQVHGEYYIFKPDNKNYNDSFYSRTLDFVVNGSTYVDIGLESVKSVPKNGKAIVKNKGTSRNPNRPELYAFESDGDFKVVYNTNIGELDSRRTSTGKNIKNMKTKELVELLTKLDKSILLKLLGKETELLEEIDKKGIKRAVLHNLIKKYMTENSLIFDSYEKFEGVQEEDDSEDEVTTNQYDEDEMY